MTTRTIWVGAQSDVVDVSTIGDDSLVAMAVNGEVLALSFDEAARLGAALIEKANAVRAKVLK